MRGVGYFTLQPCIGGENQKILFQRFYCILHTLIACLQIATYATLPLALLAAFHATLPLFDYMAQPHGNFAHATPYPTTAGSDNTLIESHKASMIKIPDLPKFYAKPAIDSTPYKD